MWLLPSRFKEVYEVVVYIFFSFKMDLWMNCFSFMRIQIFTGSSARHETPREDYAKEVGTHEKIHRDHFQTQKSNQNVMKSLRV